jgi:hypothetical protein
MTYNSWWQEGEKVFSVQIKTIAHQQLEGQ